MLPFARTLLHAYLALDSHRFRLAPFRDGACVKDSSRVAVGILRAQFHANFPSRAAD